MILGSSGRLITEAGDAPDTGFVTPYKLDPGDTFDGRIESPTDLDRIEVQIEQGYDYLVWLYVDSTTLPSEGYTAYLLDPAFTLPRAGDTAAGGTPADFVHNVDLIPFSNTGLHVIEISSTRSTDSFDYRVVVERDAGQSENTQATIALNQTVTGDLPILFDRDWYSTLLNAGQSYAFIARMTDPFTSTQDLQLQLRVQGQSNGVKGRNYLTGETIVEVIPSADQTYFIAVEDGGTGTSTDYFGGYELMLISDPLGTADTQEMTSVGGTYAGAFDYYGDEDWVAVSLEAGKSYDVSMAYNVTRGAAMAKMVVYNAAGGFVVQSDNISQSSSGAVTFTATTTGTYFMAPTSTGSDIEASYRFTVSETQTASGRTTGPDLITGTSGADALAGLTGDDTIFGGDGNDTLLGDEDADLLGGGAGDDSLLGGAGDDAIFGAAGNDFASGGDGADTLGGAAGNDWLEGGQGADALWGSLGDDTLSGGSEADTLGGADGNDQLNGGTGNDELWGALGHDTLTGDSGDDTLGGSLGNDSLSGGDGADELWGAAGTDTLNGGEGDDSVGAGLDDDLASGGAGNDQVFGGLGNDTLFGNDGDDTLFGAAGDDMIDGGDGNDDIYAGSGADVIVFSTGADRVFFMSATEDTLGLQAAVGILDYNDLVTNHMTEVSGSAVITDADGSSMTLDGLAMAVLTQDFFDF